MPNQSTFKEPLVFSTLTHALLLLLALVWTTANRKPSQTFYSVDLSVGSFSPAPSGQDSQSWSVPDEVLNPVITPPENKDFLETPSKEKTKKPEAKPSAPSSPSTRVKSSPGTGTGSGNASVGMGLGGGNFPFPAYAEAVRRKIAMNWQAQFWRDNLLTRKTQVAFLIRKDGSISSPALEERSGDSSYDMACLRSVQMASPFPPLPSGLDKNEIRIVFDFEIAP